MSMTAYSRGDDSLASYVYQSDYGLARRDAKKGTVLGLQIKMHVSNDDVDFITETN